MTDKTNKGKPRGLAWWQLTLLGVACTIGTGYYLGSGIGIQAGGLSFMLMFMLAALGACIVFDLLARMIRNDPAKGTFQTYAAKAFGRWAGFSSGWIYLSSELFIMGSQLTALSLFTRFWLPQMPVWLLASGYALLGLAVILLGPRAFERTETVFAIIKVSAIVMFLVLAGAAVLGLMAGAYPPKLPTGQAAFMPKGLQGTVASLLFAFYAFGGIEIMGIMATRLRRPEEALKAGTMMIAVLGVIYIASLTLALTLAPLPALQGKQSPFQAALSPYQLPYVPHAFNAVFIIAGFSTMVASLFAITAILVTLAEDHHAPAVFARRTSGKRSVPLPAIAFSACGITAAVVMALLLPESLYTNVTTAAGIMLLLNWKFILLASGRLLTLTRWGKLKRYSGMLLILAAISGSLLQPDSRPGFWISLLFIAIIGVIAIALNARWKRETPSSASSAFQPGKLPLHRPDNREGAT